MRPKEITLEINPGGTWRFDYPAWGLRIKLPDDEEILVFHHKQEGVLLDDLTVQWMDKDGKASDFIDLERVPFDTEFWYPEADPT